MAGAGCVCLTPASTARVFHCLLRIPRVGYYGYLQFHSHRALQLVVFSVLALASVACSVLLGLDVLSGDTVDDPLVARF